MRCGRGVGYTQPRESCGFMDITSRVFVSSGGKVIAFVLDKARVEKWIGPSLLTRPQFVQTQLDSGPIWVCGRHLNE